MILPLSLFADGAAHDLWMNLRPCGAPPGESGINQIMALVDEAAGTHVSEAVDGVKPRTAALQAPEPAAVLAALPVGPLSSSSSSSHTSSTDACGTVLSAVKLQPLHPVVQVQAAGLGSAADSHTAIFAPETVIKPRQRATPADVAAASGCSCEDASAAAPDTLPPSIPRPTVVLEPASSTSTGLVTADPSHPTSLPSPAPAFTSAVVDGSVGAQSGITFQPSPADVIVTSSTSEASGHHAPTVSALHSQLQADRNEALADAAEELSKQGHRSSHHHDGRGWFGAYRRPQDGSIDFYRLFAGLPYSDWERDAAAAQVASASSSAPLPIAAVAGSTGGLADVDGGTGMDQALAAEAARAAAASNALSADVTAGVSSYSLPLLYQRAVQPEGVNLPSDTAAVGAPDIDIDVNGAVMEQPLPLQLALNHGSAAPASLWDQHAQLPGGLPGGALYGGFIASDVSNGTGQRATRDASAAQELQVALPHVTGQRGITDVSLSEPAAISAYSSVPQTSTNIDASSGGAIGSDANANSSMAAFAHGTMTYRQALAEQAKLYELYPNLTSAVAERSVEGGERTHKEADVCETEVVESTRTRAALTTLPLIPAASAGSVAGTIVPPLLATNALVHDYGLGRIRLQVQLRFDPVAEFWSHYTHYEEAPVTTQPAYSAALLVHNHARLYALLAPPLTSAAQWLWKAFTWTDPVATMLLAAFILLWTRHSWALPVLSQAALLRHIVVGYVRLHLKRIHGALRQPFESPPVPPTIAAGVALLQPGTASSGPGSVSLPLAQAAASAAGDVLAAAAQEAQQRELIKAAVPCDKDSARAEEGRALGRRARTTITSDGAGSRGPADKGNNNGRRWSLFAIGNKHLHGSSATTDRFHRSGDSGSNAASESTSTVDADATTDAEDSSEGSATFSSALSLRTPGHPTSRKLNAAARAIIARAQRAVGSGSLLLDVLAAPIVDPAAAEQLRLFALLVGSKLLARVKDTRSSNASFEPRQTTASDSRLTVRERLGIPTAPRPATSHKGRRAPGGQLVAVGDVITAISLEAVPATGSTADTRVGLPPVAELVPANAATADAATGGVGGVGFNAVGAPIGSSLGGGWKFTGLQPLRPRRITTNLGGSTRRYSRAALAGAQLQDDAAAADAEATRQKRKMGAGKVRRVAAKMWPWHREPKGRRLIAASTAAATDAAGETSSHPASTSSTSAAAASPATGAAGVSAVTSAAAPPDAIGNDAATGAGRIAPPRGGGYGDATTYTGRSCVVTLLPILPITASTSSSSSTAISGSVTGADSSRGKGDQAALAASQPPPSSSSIVLSSPLRALSRAAAPPAYSLALGLSPLTLALPMGAKLLLLAPNTLIHDTTLLTEAARRLRTGELPQFGADPTSNAPPRTGLKGLLRPTLPPLPAPPAPGSSSAGGGGASAALIDGEGRGGRSLLFSRRTRYALLLAAVSDYLTPDRPSETLAKVQNTAGSIADGISAVIHMFDWSVPGACCYTSYWRASFFSLLTVHQVTSAFCCPQ